MQCLLPGEINDELWCGLTVMYRSHTGSYFSKVFKAKQDVDTISLVVELSQQYILFIFSVDHILRFYNNVQSQGFLMYPKIMPEESWLFHQEIAHTATILEWDQT